MAIVSEANMNQAINSHLQRKSPRTIEAYKRYYRLFSDYFKDKAINVFNLKQFQVDVLDNLPLSSQQVGIYSIKSLLKFLFQSELVDKNLSDILTKSRQQYVRKEDRSGLDDNQYEILLEKAKETNPMMAIYIELANLTGARRNELRRMKVADFTDKGNGVFQINFPNTKGGKSRKINVRPSDDIKRLIRNTDQTYVFENLEINQPYSISSIDKFFRKIVKSAEGLDKDYSSHFLRHRFVNRMLNAGHPIQTVKELIGHSNIQTTSRYTHADVDNIVVE